MKDIISASRRTDMPAYYLDRLTTFLQKGSAEVKNPFSGSINTVNLRPEQVHTIVLWSKNFAKFLEKTKSAAIFDRYNLYFLFTINDMTYLEPGIPPLAVRLSQLDELAVRYGPERIAWRFDPVVFTAAGPIMGNDTFRRIGQRVVASGVTRTIFSFLDMYGKVKKRNNALNLQLTDPPPETKTEYASGLMEIAGELGLTLESCCEEIDDVDGIERSSCINGTLLGELACEPARRSVDSGQRKMCRCTVSRDIGSYDDMPCPGGCMYCYANPLIDKHEVI